MTIKISSVLFLAFSCATLAGCGPSINETQADAFQSLPQAQQVQYWQNKKITYLRNQVKKQDISIFTQGNNIVLTIPASHLFENNTPYLSARAEKTLTPVVNLINAESTPGIQILAYANSPDPQYAFALTQNWTQRISQLLRGKNLNVAFISAKGMGKCDTISTDFSRIEIRYSTHT